MSSLGNNTTASSLPPGQTPTFIRRISNAYTAAFEALMSPTPTPRTRPDPMDTDPIIPPFHRPPQTIEVETVYSADISRATLPASSAYNGPFISVDDSSRPTSPLSLFPTDPVLSGPVPVVPHNDPFSPASPRDPGMSPINAVTPPIDMSQQNPSITSQKSSKSLVRDPTSHDVAFLSHKTDIDTGSAASLLHPTQIESRATSPISHQQRVSTSHQSSSSHQPSLQHITTSVSPPLNHGLVPVNTAHLPNDPSSPTTAAAAAVTAAAAAAATASSTNVSSLLSTTATALDGVASSAPPSSSLLAPPLRHNGGLTINPLAPPSAFPMSPIIAPSPVTFSNPPLPSLPVTTVPPSTSGPSAAAVTFASNPVTLNLVSQVAPTNAVATTTRQYLPASMPTPWSAAARAAAPFSVQQAPPTIYAPNNFGTPGFHPVCSPVPAPTMVSSGLDIVSQPRSPSNGLLARQPRVPKHKRGDTAVDIEKLIGYATASLPSDYSLRYFSTTGVLDPKQYSPKIAEYYTSFGMTVDALIERCIDYDLLAPIEMYECFDFATATVSGRTYNLLQESHLVELPRVLEWQYFCRLHSSQADLLSDSMISKLVLKTLDPAVRQDVVYDLAELPEHLRGGSATVKIAMDKLAADSFEIRLCIQNGLTSFTITSYPQEDVVLASQHVKTLARFALQYNDLPPRVLGYVLRGFTQSSCDPFNNLCHQFILREEMESGPPAPGQNVQKRDFDLLLSVTSKLSQYYRNAVQSGTWPAALKQSSSFVAAAPAPPTTAALASSTDMDALLTALVSRLSMNGSPRSTSYRPSRRFPCNHCGSPDHWRNECPQLSRSDANTTSRQDSHQRPRSTSRPRSDSRSRSDSHSRSHSRSRSDSRSRSGPSDRPRSNSRDDHRGRPILRNPTPRPVRDNSRDRAVAFDAQAHNATLGTSVPSAADLLRNINGRSLN